jgi:hypothetical protein
MIGSKPTPAWTKLSRHELSGGTRTIGATYLIESAHFCWINWKPWDRSDWYATARKYISLLHPEKNIWDQPKASPRSVCVVLDDASSAETANHWFKPKYVAVESFTFRPVGNTSPHDVATSVLAPRQISAGTRLPDVCREWASSLKLSMRPQISQYDGLLGLVRGRHRAAGFRVVEVIVEVRVATERRVVLERGQEHRCTLSTR